jgi:hypothetical protein
VVFPNFAIVGASALTAALLARTRALSDIISSRRSCSSGGAVAAILGGASVSTPPALDEPGFQFRVARHARLAPVGLLVLDRYCPRGRIGREDGWAGLAEIEFEQVESASARAAAHDLEAELRWARRRR